MPEGKNISALLANLEALANDGDVRVGIGSNTCPNGGQKQPEGQKINNGKKLIRQTVKEK